MSADRLDLRWYAGGRGGDEGGGGDDDSIRIFRGSWSVLDDEASMEWRVEGVGVMERDGGSDAGLERGDEWVDGCEEAKLTTE